MNNPLKYTDPSGYKFAELPEPMIYYNLGWLKYAGYGWSEDYGGHATIRGIGGGGGYGYRAKYEMGGPYPYEWQYDNGDYVNRRTGDRIDAGYGADALRAIGLVIAEASVDEYLEMNPIVRELGEQGLWEDERGVRAARNIGYGKSFDGDPEKSPLDPDHTDSFDGFWGKVKHFLIGGNENGACYDWNGNYIGPSPIMGFPPIPGIGGKLAVPFKGFTVHGIQQAITRGITSPTILKTIRMGEATLASGRYGAQIKYVYEGITVVVATTGRNAGKIITIMVP